MSDVSTATSTDELDDSPLKRSITGRLLFFYVLGDVLGSGIYVLIGALRRSMATTGYTELKEFQRIEVVVQ